MSFSVSASFTDRNRRSVNRALWVAGLIVVGLGTLAMINVAVLGTARAAVTRAVATERAVDKLLSALDRAAVVRETVPPAEAIAGLTYEQRRAESALGELSRLYANDPARAATLDTVAHLTADRFTALAGGATAYRSIDYDTLNDRIDRLLNEEQRTVDARRNRVRLLAIGMGVLQAGGFLALLVLLYYVYRRLLPLNRRLAEEVEEKDEIIDRHESTELTRRMMVERLRARNQDLDNFAYIASHDLQEPLRTVRSFIGLLREDHGQDLGGDSLVYFQFINEATERMQRMITSLLRYSQLGRSIERQSVDLSGVIQDVISDLGAQIKASEGSVTAGWLPTIWGLESEMRQLFQNLISNALKFVDPGQKPIVVIDCEATEEGYTVSISDNGIGMDEAALDKIFNMFSRVNKPGAYAGYGIGLTFCRKIVELHGGVLSVQSIPGEGTTFYFTLPFYVIQSEPARKPPPVN